MSFLVNIGVTDRSQLFAVMRAVRAAGLIQHQAFLRGETLVAELSVSGAFTSETRKVARLSADLKRDCIAYYHQGTREGYLLGPYPDLHGGAFDPTKFVMLDGSKLAQEVAA